MKNRFRALILGVACCALHATAMAAATEGELIVYSYNDAKAEADREAGKLSWSDYYRASLLSFSRTKTERMEAFRERFKALIEVSMAMESGAITRQQFDETRDQINEEANQAERQYWAAKKAQEERDGLRRLGQALGEMARSNEETARRNAEAVRAARPVVCESQMVLGTMRTVCK